MGSLVEDENLHRSRIRLENLERTTNSEISKSKLTYTYLSESNTGAPNTLLYFSVTGTRFDTASGKARHMAFRRVRRHRRHQNIGSHTMYVEVYGSWRPVHRTKE